MQTKRILSLLIIPLLSLVPSLLALAEENTVDFFPDDFNHTVQFGVENGLNLYWAHSLGQDKFLRWGVRPYTWGDFSKLQTTELNNSDEREVNRMRYDLDVFVDVLVPFNPHGPVRMYWGYGPLVGIGFYRTENVEEAPDYSGLEDYTEVDDTWSWRAGARVLIGGEYAFTSRLSGFVETNLSGFIERSRREGNDVSIEQNNGAGTYYYDVVNEETTSLSWEVALSSVIIGVSFRY